MKLDELIARTEAWAQEELGAQQRLIELFEAQERALVRNDMAELQARTHELETVLRGTQSRAARRDELVAGFQREFGVPAECLSLGSISERLGGRGARLASLREPLRIASQEASRLGRKLTTLASYHAGLVEDVARILVGEGQPDYVPGGSILNAEA